MSIPIFILMNIKWGMDAAIENFGHNIHCNEYHDGAQSFEVPQMLEGIDRSLHFN